MSYISIGQNQHFCSLKGEWSTHANEQKMETKISLYHYSKADQTCSFYKPDLKNLTD